MLELAAPRSQRACAHVPSTSDPRWSLWVAVLGSSMAFLDGTVVNVALPVIQREMSAQVTTMQWVMEAYSLLLASLVLVGGALGDRFGRRRVFAIGAGVFALASAACGLAPSALTLLLARAVQGAGAALLVPGSLALISAAYGPRERGAAIGTWSAASAVTGALGPVAGGLLIAHASWRWLFLLNVPIAALVIVLALRHVPESRDDSAPKHMDWKGTLSIVTGLGLLVYGLLESVSLGSLLHARILSVLAAGAALLVVFVFIERRQREPIVPLELFASRTFSGANLLTLLLYAALGAVFFFLPFNLIQVQGYTPAAAGAALLPFVLSISLLSRLAGGWVVRFGARLLLTVGPLAAAVGFGLLAIPGMGGSYLATFFPGALVLGLGMGVTVAPLTTVVMASVDARHAGLASGINNAVARTAGLLAIAALGLVLVQRFNSELDVELAALQLPGDVLQAALAQRTKLGAPDLSWADPNQRALLQHAFAAAFVAAFRTLMLVSAGLAALSALAAALMIDPSTTQVEAAAEPELAGGPVAPR